MNEYEALSCRGSKFLRIEITGTLQVADGDQMDQTCLGYRLRALLDVKLCCTALASVAFSTFLFGSYCRIVKGIVAMEGGFILSFMDSEYPHHVICQRAQLLPNYPQ